MSRELLKSGAETREVEIDTADSGLLEFRHAGPNSTRDQRLDVLPIIPRTILRHRRSWPTHKKNGTVCRRLILDMQTTLGFGVDGPRGAYGEARFHEALG